LQRSFEVDVKGAPELQLRRARIDEVAVKQPGLPCALAQDGHGYEIPEGV
jgi:hypothetical protein